jgi:tetratricopeptide (TPR) repeat protein
MNVAWMNRLDREHDNLRAALTWSCAHDPASGLSLAGQLFDFWGTYGYLSEGREYLERLLAQGEGVRRELLEQAIYYAGFLASRQGDFVHAWEQFSKSLGLAQELDDKQGQARVLNGMGIVRWSQGNYAEAQDLFEKALAITREIGDLRGAASKLSNLGNIYLANGDYETARKYHEESLAISRQLDSPYDLATALNNIGVCAEAQEDYPAAQRYYEECLVNYKIIGSKGDGLGYAYNSLAHLQLLQGDLDAGLDNYRQSLLLSVDTGEKRLLAYCFEGFGMVRLRQSKLTQGVRMLAGADELRIAIGAPLNQSERAEVEQALGMAREGLGALEFEEAWRSGRTMTTEQLTRLALDAT